MNKIEILAPSGNLESFMSAVSAGADAVYLGLKEFNARAKAKNFSYQQLNEICNYAHKNNVKVFVALNTLIKNSEINSILKILENIHLSKADAVIVQDLGVAYLAQKYFPQINLHASTQLTIHNSYGAKQAQQMGFKRVVLARELSVEEIKFIKSNSNIELEIFCHGALCFCISGLCLFSSFIGGYSGNRGHCSQPCRRLWTVDNKKGYFLSPKDFQIADYINKIKDIGITSLKIEGRLKSPDYVSKTVKAYRLLIDSTKEDYKYNLKQAKEILFFDYARQKTTFNFDIKNENIFEPQKSKNLGLFLGNIEENQDNSFILKTNYDLSIGDTIRIVDNRKDRSFILKIKNLIKESNYYKINFENLYLEKGFEIYKISDAKTDIKYEKISETVTKLPQPKQKIKISQPRINRNVNLPKLFLRINNIKWFNLFRNINASIVVKISKNDINDIKNFVLKNKIKDLYFEFPSYIDEQDIKSYEKFISFCINKNYNSFFVNNISQIYLFKNKKVILYAGQFLYTLNSYSAEFLSKYNIKSFVVSWEDDLYNIKDLSKVLKKNLIIYLSGFPEIVISKMKFIKDVCNKNIKSNKDEFRVISQYSNIIIPKYPVNLFGFKNKLLSMGIKSFGIDLSYINPNTNYLTQILKVFNNNLYINSSNKFNFERQLK